MGPGCNMLVPLKDTRGDNVVDGCGGLGKNSQARHPGGSPFKPKNMC